MAQAALAAALMAALCSLLPAHAVAGTAAAGVGVAVGAPFWPGPAYPWPAASGACMGYGVCGAWGWDRRPLRRPVAPEAPVFEQHDIWGPTGNPWGYVRRLPPPTPESQIQPRFRDASTVRPEFETR